MDSVWSIKAISMSPSPCRLNLMGDTPARLSTDLPYGRKCSRHCSLVCPAARRVGHSTGCWDVFTVGGPVVFGCEGWPFGWTGFTWQSRAPPQWQAASMLRFSLMALQRFVLAIFKTSNQSFWIIRFVWLKMKWRFLWFLSSHALILTDLLLLQPR